MALADRSVEDPKGLIRESYRIEGIEASQCRSIFLDWALSLAQGVDPRTAIAAALATYGEGQEGHPMSEVLRNGLTPALTSGPRRGGRAGRFQA